MGTRSLTQVEAQERAALLQVLAYDVHVDLTDLPTGPAVACVATVTFDCRTPGATSFVDCAAEVLEATLNGAPLGEAVDGRIELPDLADHNTLVVSSVQRRTTDGEGVHKAVDPADGQVYLWMSFEPDEARHVWACFDQPDLKAPHAFTVTAPGAWRVVSNSAPDHVEEDGDARVWTFPATPPLSTYNPVVLAGPFHELRREVDGHDLGLFCRQSLAALLDRDADELFTVTAQGLAFFGDRFGMPFPQHKYDQVFVPELGGAMENYGCVTWSDAFLRRATPTPAEEELFALVLLHEMAHMWFGNIVTMRWWDDLWLNEAFAEFACLWAAVSATRHTEARVGFLALDQISAYTADQGPTTHPIRQPVRDVEEAASIFDAITYPKGASVLQQLLTYVGEDRFVAGMTAYFARHAWGNTTLDDLIEALAEASGRDLDRWRAGWLETAGTDRLTLEEGEDGTGPVLVATGPGGGEPRPHVLAVGAYRDAGASWERVALTRVEVDGRRTTLDLPAGADLYLPNDENLTFATTRPDPASRDLLVGRAGELPTPLGRGVAVATVWDLLINGEASAAETVRCLAGVLRTETAPAAVEPYLRLAGDAAELWAPDAERAALEAEVVATCRALLPGAGDALRQVALRAAVRAAAAEDLDGLRAEAGDDVDLRWRLLVRQAEVATVEPGEVDELRGQDPDPDSWVRALTVRAATASAEEKEAVWAVSVVDRKVPVSSVRTIGAAFWRRSQATLLAPYAERYLDGLDRFDEGGMIPGMVYTSAFLPLVGVDEDFLALAAGRAESAAPVVRKTLAERSDQLRRMLRSRSLSG